MPILAIAFPQIDPVFFWLGPLPVRWYGLAYVFGLLFGWLYARLLVRTDRLWGAVARPSAQSLDDLLVYAALGAVIGGRLFQVLIYDPGYYLSHPDEIVAVWHGGMAFHGGLIGVALGALMFARRHAVPKLVVADICATVAPIGIFFGRVANFIKPEMWGRPADVPWAVHRRMVPVTASSVGFCRISTVTCDPVLLKREIAAVVSAARMRYTSSAPQVLAQKARRTTMN